MASSGSCASRRLRLAPPTHPAEADIAGLSLARSGWLLPPLAVLVRFGVGWDLCVVADSARRDHWALLLTRCPARSFINIILTCCGYIPGHGHKYVILLCILICTS